MDAIFGDQITSAGLADWRKLAQGLHGRFLIDDFSSGARFVLAVAEAADAANHHPRVVLAYGQVDLELVTHEAVYREDDGTRHRVEWVTEKDLELARTISGIAADHGLRADPSAVSEVELGLDTADSSAIAPVWAALLTGDAESQGRGSPSDEIRDATVRVPNLWFGDAPDEDARQRFHVEVYLPPEARDARIAAVLAAGGTIVDDSRAPGLTVVADQDGNRGVICVDA